ncbi:hypothetical protein ACFLVN_05715 [Chloroflexota bacterium]
MRDDIVTISYIGAAAFKAITATSKRILIDPHITQNALCRKDLEDFYATEKDMARINNG